MKRDLFPFRLVRTPLKKKPALGGREPRAGLGQMHTDLGKISQPLICYEHNLHLEVTVCRSRAVMVNHPRHTD
jgi:hypothetical protein